MIDLGPYEEIATGTYRVFATAGESWLVAKVDRDLVAVRDLCTHQPRPLNGGDLEGGVIECPHHATAYDLRSGAVVRDCGFTHLEPLERRRCEVRDGRLVLLPGS